MCLLKKIIALFRFEKLMDMVCVCLRIIGSDHRFDISSGRLILAYLKIELYKFLNIKNNHEKIGNLDILFHEYSSFSMLFKDIFLDREYDFKTDKKNPLIIDCGANIGMSVLFFKQLYPEAEIIGFEPDKANFEILTANIAANRLENIRVHNKALSDTEGIIALYSAAGNPFGSLIVSTMEGRVCEKHGQAESLRLSRYITRCVDFLKIDVEGAERAILRELYESGKLHNINEMIIEYHHHVQKDKDDFSDFLAVLEKSGFGYQIGGVADRPYQRNRFQNIMVYAYQNRGDRHDGRSDV